MDDELFCRPDKMPPTNNSSYHIRFVRSLICFVRAATGCRTNVVVGRSKVLDIATKDYKYSLDSAGIDFRDKRLARSSYNGKRHEP